jgi:hypothetical protein
MWDLVLLLIACHFIGDFPFQSEFFALNKGKSWEINFYHAITYTATFVIFAKIDIAFSILLLITHFIIDALKARYGLIKHIWIDQILHIMVILTYVYNFTETIK